MMLAYSSENLFLLSRIKVDIIKLDMRFAKKLLEPNEYQSEIKAVKSFTSVSDINVIAEGIESNEQLAQIKLLGINYVQGWLFSKSLRVEAFLDFFAKNTE